MTKLRVLFASAEAAPFAKVGGLADVVGSLPQALVALGHEVAVALPLYGSIDRAKWGIDGASATIAVPFGGITTTVRVHELARAGVRWLFLDEPRLLGRTKVYGEPDDGRRFAFFCCAVAELAASMDPAPDVVHAHDWHTALTPQLLKEAFAERLPQVASVFTIHNLAYQGVTKERLLALAGLPEDRLLIEKKRYGKQLSLMARGIAFADVVSTVSPRYAEEILTPEFGEGLEPLLDERRSDLYGVLNGIDTTVFDPRSDPNLVARYDAGDLSGKAACKRALQEELRLETGERIPIFGVVGRLVEQKGVDLLTAIAPALLDGGAELVVLGSGDPAYEARWRELEEASPYRLGLRLGFDAALAQRIYAASDMFLMPSRFEPCGLGQLISLRYGTVPVVRAVGGLADTVRDHDADPKNGNGFAFGPYQPVAFADATRRALRAYARPETWRELQRRGMREDHSWGASAGAYVDLYAAALAQRTKREVVA